MPRPLWMLCCKLWIDVGFFLEWLFCFVLFFSYYGDRVCLGLLDYLIIRHIIHQHHSVKSEQSCTAHCCCCVEISLKPLADMSSPLPREVNTGNGVKLLPGGTAVLGRTVLYKNDPFEILLACGLLCSRILQQSLRRDPSCLVKRKGATVVTSPMPFGDLLRKRKRRSKAPLTVCQSVPLSQQEF